VTEASPLRARRVVEVLATSAGGVGAHVRTIVPAITAAGASVGVCGAPATEQLFGFSAVGADFSPVGISSGLAPVADSRAVAQLRRATAGADLVHAHGLRAGLVAAVARRLSGERQRPLVLTLHNALQESSGPRQRLLRAVEGLTIRGADLVLAVSSDLADNARRLGARDVRVVPALAPPLPPADRTRAEVRDELGLDEGRPLVVAVGRLHPQKGYDVLLDAVARWEREGRLHPAPLVAIAGDGPLEAELAQRIRTERLPILLLGRRSDVADLLGAADLAVVTSAWEARQLFAQEALRAGVPLVATSVGGLPDLVGDAAVLVPPDDVDAVDAAVRRLLDDPAARADYARRGAARAAGWPTEAETVAQVRAVYAELVDRRRRPSSTGWAR
jgi:glycosyltransferase involved in cell wall biosynthesis